jgi:fatty-acyl-CoA synthase
VTTFAGPPLAGRSDVGALTLGGFLAEVAERFGPAEALVLDDPLRDGATVRWTYDDLFREGGRIGRGLVARGVAPGEAVAVVMADRPEAVAALFGAALAGAVVVPMSTFATPRELGHMLERASAVAVLTQARLGPRDLGAEVAGLAAGLPASPSVAVVGDRSWDGLLADGDEVPGERLEAWAAVSPDDPGLVIFTSGTTSEPKAILHGHRSPCLQFWLLARTFGRDRTTRMFSALPLFWTAGLNTAMGSTLAAGGCWVMQEVFEAGAALALLARERVTEPYTLPHQTVALAEHPDWPTTDLSSLRCVYGKSAFARHPTVHGDPDWIMPVGYGLSETCSFVSGYDCRTPREQARIGAGPLMPGVRLRVVDPESGRCLGVGEEGELAVGGATLMLGYLGAPPGAGLDADRFFHTGDAGHVDADGIVHFSGRRTEMIKTGGANVSPAELEVALRACAPVKLSRVIGVPDARLGQVAVACIVPAEGTEPTEDDIRSFLRGRVASYKVPRHVLFLAESEMPMTGSDTKVRDDALRAVVAERLGGLPTASDPTTTGER